ncbi:MAG: hypothetical protein JNK67_30500 [Alphaproteobacteria bacterium]|nr:hypothetical protein [Alphaproteobacteria bacterium]
MSTAANRPKAKFVRIWRGRTRREVADAYQAYWLAQGTRPLVERGAIGVRMLRDDRGDTSAFMTISYWPSLEAMTGGRGGDPLAAHHLARDAEFLMELPERVEILTIVDSTDE